MTIRIAVGGGLGVTPVLLNASDDFAAYAENISEEQDRIEAQRDAREEQEDNALLAAAMRSDNNIGGPAYDAREAAERARLREIRRSAREKRARERAANRTRRSEQKVINERNSKLGASNNFLKELQAVEKAKAAAAAAAKAKAEADFNRKIEENRRLTKNVDLSTNLSDEIKTTSLPTTLSSPPIFRPPVITRNRHEFRNLENSTRLRGRIEVDPDVDINSLMRAASLTPRRPEIVAKMPLFQLLTNFEGTSELSDLRQYERYLQLETLDTFWENIKRADTTNIIREIERNNVDSFDRNLKNLDFLSSLRDVIDQSIDFFDIRKNSKQLTSEAKAFSGDLLVPREEGFYNFPDNIEEFLSEKCGFSSLAPKYFSNTKLLHSILREFSNSVRCYCPGMLTSQRRPRDDKFAFKYNSISQERQGENNQESSVSTWGTRNYRIATNAVSSVALSAPRPVTESFYNSLPGLKNVDANNDRIKILSTLLHNELVVSSGISRLYNTPLGNKYTITSVDPIERIIGGYFKNSGNVLTGAGSAMSFADMLVINEFNATASAILPFEQRPVKDANSRIYIPGSSYFVESPLKAGDLSTPLASFNASLSTLNSDAQTLLKTLLCFDEECKFTPDNIVIRCLKSIRDIVNLITSSSETNKVSTTVVFSTVLLSVIRDRVFKVRPENVFSNQFEQKPIDMMFSLCSYLRGIFDAQGEVQPFLPAKSYAYLVGGQTHPFENSEGTSDTSFVDFARKLRRILQENIVFTSIESFRLFNPQSADSIQFENINLADAGDLTDEKVSNILVSIVEVLRSIQQDVFAVSTKNSLGNSYLDDDRLTRFNRWDDNTMLACIFSIFEELISGLFPAKNIIINTNNEGNSIYADWDELACFRLKDYLDILINAYEADQPLDSIFDALGNVDSIYNVNRSTYFKPGGFSAGQIVELINSLIEHRKFLKLSLGYLSAVTKNVNSANLTITSFFEGNNSSNNESARRYSDLLTSLGGRLSIETLTPEQNNIKRNYYLSTLPIEKSSLLKKCTFNSQTEDQIQDFFIREMFNTANDGIAICFGLPAGLIESERNPIKAESSSLEIDEEIYPERSIRKKDIKITFNKVSELYPDIDFTPIELDYDSELFILPDSLRFTTNFLSGEQIKNMRSLIDGTIFTRINNGRILSSKTGHELKSEGFAESILRNHIVDRIYKNFARDVMGITLDEHMWFMDSNFSSMLIDSSTYASLENLIANENITALTNLSLDKIRLIFEDAKVPGLEGMKKLCSAGKLRQLLGSNVSYNDINTIIKMLGSNIFNANVEEQRLIVPRHFDRVFVALFSNDRNSNFFLNNFDISNINMLPGDIDNLKKVFNNFEISGYMCSVELK